MVSFVRRIVVAAVCCALPAAVMCNGPPGPAPAPKAALKKPYKVRVVYVKSETCFPTEAHVRIKDSTGLIVDAALANVHVGDDVISHSDDGRPVVDTLIDQMHRLHLASHSPFLAVEHAEGTLRATGSHMIFKETEQGQLSVPMATLEVGDKLVLAGGGAASKVVSVRRSDVTTLGLEAPLTGAGTLIVDGVLASCYAAPVSESLPHGSAHAAFYMARNLRKFAVSLLPGELKVKEPVAGPLIGRLS
eukprot:TRINITY_DN19851_c0_g1_i3.p1 TRINITY_DN19851_c0_g1~~TRINITY_DN19851_c0_g1_i3.p1  ORF type:complete len:247 (+),score=35.55 TRINITY_DN19851_c0_g1_i3:70-810(+)